LEKVKRIAWAFLVGGLLSLMGELFLLILQAIFGPDSPFVGPLTLILMGLFALVTFPLGIYQKIDKVGGFGAILPFCGFAASVARAYCTVIEKKGSPAAGVLAGVKVVCYVIGFGSITAVIVAAIMAFVL